MTSDAAPRPGHLRILVTGASGLVGRELCGVLTDRGHDVVTLLHRNRILERNDGATIPTRSYDEEPRGSYGGGVVTLLDGDVTTAGFGLTAQAKIALAESIDVIVRCAAVTAFNLPRSTCDRLNVGSTAQVLAFAAQAGRGIGVLHVITAYVCGTAGGVVPEAPTTASRFNNGYEASKAAAEALVLAAHRRGQPVAIARPAIVSGDLESGAIGAFGSLYQLLRLVTGGRSGALPAWPDASLNLVPIDHLAGALVDITERMEQADGRILHLAAGDPVRLIVLETPATDFLHLQTPRLMPAERFDKARLSPRQQWLHATVTALYAPYLRPSPSFVIANLTALSGRRCPTTDVHYVRRLVRYAVTTGFLPAEGVRPISARPDSADPGCGAARPPSSR